MSKVNQAGDVGPRRDNAPHRGRLLMDLSLAAVAAGALSICIWPIAVAVPLGALVTWCAHSDLRRITRGEMDPQGECQTREARSSGVLAVILGLLFLGLLAFVFLEMRYAVMTHPVKTPPRPQTQPALGRAP
jgi:hypothetical protein